MLTEEILEGILPHGSGIDLRWEIEDKGNYFKGVNAFHCMNDAGYYCGYADFSIIIPKNNPLDFRLHFHGKQSHYYNTRLMLRDYIEETIYYALQEHMERTENE